MCVSLGTGAWPLMQMLQSWTKGTINGEIELYSSRSLQNPGFMALEKHI